MKFKVLKHKTIDNIFGVITEIDEKLEICHSTKPDLLGPTATMEDFKKLMEKHELVLQQLADYDMVRVNVTIAKKQT